MSNLLVLKLKSLSISSGSPSPSLSTSRSLGPELPYKDARGLVLERFEKHYLPKLLEVTKGNVSAAARHAKMDRSHLIELLTRHGLKA